MAIGTITPVADGGYLASAPLGVDLISFAGDTSYPTGGTADFEGSVQAILGKTVKVLTVIPGDCGGYTPVYDYTNDKLMVYYGNTDAADGPNIEVPNATALNGVTFRVAVLSK